MLRIIQILSPISSWLSCRKPLSYSQLRAFCQKGNASSKSDSSNKSPPSKIPFEYPEPKINVIEESKTLREIYDTDVAHLNKYLKDSKNTPFRRPIFRREYEFVVIGGGPVGSSIAYWLRKIGGPQCTVLVIDKDLSTNRFSRDIDNGHLAAALSVGQLRQLYSLKENVELSRFGAEFLRKMSDIVEYDDIDSIPHKPFGYLTLATPLGSERLKELFKDATKYGAQSELLTPFQINQRYPWLNTDKIHVAAHGLQDEGWFDPWKYLLQLRSNAIREGTIFLEAVPLEFQYNLDELVQFIGFEETEYKPTNAIVIKTTEGEILKIKFCQVILALGADTGDFAKEMLHIDSRYSGMHQYEIPIKRRKRYVYSFEAPDGPEFSSPMVVDPSGLYFRREGLLQSYICSCPPLPNEEPNTDSLEVDPNYFVDRVWPLLAARVPSFKHLRLTASWAKFDEVNTFDGSPILGLHPAYHNVYIAAGFGDRSFQQAIGVGKNIAERYIFNGDCTIDLRKFTFHRIVQNIPVFDANTC